MIRVHLLQTTASHIWRIGDDYVGADDTAWEAALREALENIS